MTTDLTPGSATWASRVSPSKLAAILGISPWDSQRSMWHKMRGEVPWEKETPAMERGTLCEPAVLAWWRKYHVHSDWQEQVSLAIGDWFAATPDARAVEGGEHVLIEAKTASADALDTWGEPGTDQIPDYYLTQVHASMEAAHRNGIPVTRTYVPVLGGRRLEFLEYVVEYDAEIGASLLDYGKRWHESLSLETPPPLDDSVATYKAVKAVHPEIDRGETVEIDEETALELVGLNAKIKALEPPLRLAKSTVIEAMGRAQYAEHKGVRIARRQPQGEAVKFIVTGKPADLNLESEEA